MFNTILFDFDGTLVDSSPGIINSLISAFDEFGITGYTMDDLRKFVGPPLVESIHDLFGFEEKKCNDIVDCFRVYYDAGGALQNDLYGGIVELLETLKSRDKVLGVASLKPLKFVKLISEQHDISKYFDFYTCNTIDAASSNKAELIRDGLGRMNIYDMDGVLMVGDRKYDIEGAKNAGVASVGALYGFGSRHELESCGADYFIDRPLDLLKLNL